MCGISIQYEQKMVDETVQNCELQNKNLLDSGIDSDQPAEDGYVGDVSDSGTISTEMPSDEISHALKTVEQTDGADVSESVTFSGEVVGEKSYLATNKADYSGDDVALANVANGNSPIAIADSLAQEDQ